MSTFDTLIDSFTFDVFDLDDSQEPPPGISVPAYQMSDQDHELVKMMGTDFISALGGSDDELYGRASDYYSMLMSDDILSADEEALFDEEYQAELDALNESYGIQFEKHGASRMADLVSRGVMETTTGSDILAEDQRTYSDLLATGTSNILQEKELRKMEAADAKRQMAQQGYNLTSGILQQRLSNRLNTTAMLQDYDTTNRVADIGRQVQNMIREQGFNQYRYNQQKSSIAQTSGLILGFLGD